ncbi:MAG: aldo/keto reductase [Gemmatimonadetes bacterium]|jgi:L-galactose dehydrogenase|nr:aldo/keto reductase [Gemmatimonadota bacterium]MBT6147098.1 aldo/keto reductase [Gemmatimonadota bacterium]MBT7862451.1 aldo/keto reductase [Gemmatimonadota bacterium]
MIYRELGRTGLEVSVLSYGASGLGNILGTPDEGRGIRTVHTAIDLGINLVDTSPMYGETRSESLLGKALRQIPRDSYYLATKVGRHAGGVSDFSAERIMQSVDESLGRLELDYVDILQCHDIDFVPLDQIVEESLPALRRLQEQGKTRFVGITGFPLKVYRYVLDRTSVDTVLSFCHYTLQDTSFSTLVPYLNERGVGIINASPLGMGLLTESGPNRGHPATDEIKAACAEAVAYCVEHGKDIARLALQFGLANPDFATTLVGTTRPEHLTKNVAWLDSDMDEELLAQVGKILAPAKDHTWSRGLPENN